MILEATIQVNHHDVHVVVESLKPMTEMQQHRKLSDIADHVRNIEANPLPKPRFNEWLR
jgi:hypothetical protein